MSDSKDLDEVRRLERVVAQLTEHLCILWEENQSESGILETMLCIARNPKDREDLKRYLLAYS